MLKSNPGVQFACFAKGGVRILDALVSLSVLLNQDVIITSGTDGVHSGPDDPHHLGNAYDIHSKDFPDKISALKSLMFSLNDGTFQEKDGGFVTTHFFGWIEDEGSSNEHIHVQLRHGETLS